MVHLGSLAKSTTNQITSLFAMENVSMEVMFFSFPSSHKELATFRTTLNHTLAGVRPPTLSPLNNAKIPPLEATGLIPSSLSHIDSALLLASYSFLCLPIVSIYLSIHLSIYLSNSIFSNLI